MTAAAFLAAQGLNVKLAGRAVLHDISLALSPGHLVALVGPNGAGKTTLLNALSGIVGDGKVAGNMSIGGKQLGRTSAIARRSAGIGRTFQHAELFEELSVIENVLVSKKWPTKRVRARAVDLLASLGILDHAHRLPTELTFGTRKQVDLARAMLQERKLLLLDEPFGGLDPDERRVLADQISVAQTGGCAIVLVDHVLEEVMAVADRAVVLNFGEVIATGTPGAVLGDPSVRASYLGEGLRPRTGLPETADAPAILAMQDVTFSYRGIRALSGVSAEIRTSSITAFVGANGAGKSTLGRILAGVSVPDAGRRVAPTIEGRSPRVALVPEGRALLKTLSIEENLLVGGVGSRLSGRDLKASVESSLEWLPQRLRDRRSIRAGALSGGEQQLVAIARALAARPDVMILDEPALGLSPVMVDDVYAKIEDLASSGVTVVLLEQLLSRALLISSVVHVVRDGAIVASGNTWVDGFEARAEQEYFGVSV